MDGSAHYLPARAPRHRGHRSLRLLARVGFRICVPVLLTATVLLAVGWTRPMLLERLATAPATYVMVVAVATVMAAAVTVRVITGSDLALVIGQIAPPVAAVTLILIV